MRPISALHVDVGGVLRVFRTTIAPYDHSFKQAGGGANVNARLALPAATALIAQGAFGSGLGRYIGGLVPDVAFARDGSISLIPARSWVTGLEHRMSPQTVFAAYYSGVSTGSQYSLDDDGRHIGFGFPGAPLSNNHWIREFTGTFSRLVTKTANRGSVQLGLQASWLQRESYPQAVGSSSTDAILVFAQLRYNLP
jgi:hypothetical protein